MKNTLKHLILALVAGVCLVATTASAQIGFDTYGATRTVQLGAPNLYSGGAAYLSGTNNWIDIRAYYGVAKIDIIGVTNVGNSTATVTIQGSNDGTNLVALTGFSYGVPTTVVYTNLIYGSTNLFATNLFVLPGTVTVPNAAVGGYATPYLARAPFTNTPTAINAPGAANGVVSLGFVANDVPRYLRLVVIPGGGATNVSIGAILTGQTGFGAP